MLVPRRVLKRDGSKVNFKIDKISQAIYKAMKAVDEGNKELADQLADKVVEKIVDKTGKKTPTVHDVQDTVEEVLLEENLNKVAKAYIIYRSDHDKMREFKDFFDGKGLVESYLKKSDWKIKENSNMDFSLQGLNNYIVNNVIGKYWLDNLYPEEIRESHNNGDYHIHDLGTLAVYCCGWDLQDLLSEGFTGVDTKISSDPPKHFRAALGQICNFFYTLQGESAGAQAFSHFDTLLAPFVREDKLTYKEVKQAMQEFVYNLNIPTRVGFQCMSEDTEVLSEKGWKKHNELKEGNVIFNFNINQRSFEKQKVNHVFSRDYEGEMYLVNSENSEQLISPKHRMVIMEEGKYEYTYKLDKVEKVIKEERNCNIPVIGEVSEDCLMGVLNGDILAFNGIITSEKFEVSKVNYKGIIWCPNTDNETVIARRNGKVFITGNTPFTNLTFDMEPPKSLKDQPVMIGGKNHETITYGDYKEEMKMINKAFAEVMMKGDANQRIFTFPIPTYNITKDIEWDSGVLKYVFEMAAKYGIPYFANYINSNIDPNDTTSMCPLVGETKVKIRIEGEEVVKRIKDIYDNYSIVEVSYEGKWFSAKVNKQENQDTVLIECLNGESMEIGVNHLQLVCREDHAYSEEVVIKGSEIVVSDYIPFVLRTGEDSKERLWIQVKKVEKGSKKDLYCFEVDNEEGLFELANGMITHNCRLRLNHSELHDMGGGLFGANPLTGSLGVVTINLPRIGYLAENEEDFFSRLENLIDKAANSLVIKRKVLERFIKAGLYPYSKFYLRAIAEQTKGESYWVNHFATIGIVGMNECCVNFVGVGIDHEDGVSFANKVLDFMRKRILFHQKQTKSLFNFEATPAESASHSLAKKDKEKYPDIITAGTEEVPYYTNSSQLPVGISDDLFWALKHQENLQTKYTGGTVFHIFLGEKLPDSDAAKNLIMNITKEYKLPYITLTPSFSICPKHGYIPGEHEYCPFEEE